MAPEQYAALLDNQGGRCAICGNKPGKYRLAVEHSHYTNTIRGLVCLPCNRNLLGALERDPAVLVDRIDRAIAFLNEVRDDFVQHRSNPAPQPTLRGPLVEPGSPGRPELHMPPGKDTDPSPL